MRYLKTTLDDGTTYVSAFRKVEKIGAYIRDVMSGKKRLNVWNIVGDTLPSGEKNLQRTRKVVNHRFVREIEEVKPKTDWNGTDFDASNFESVVLPTSGKAGLWTVPEGLENNLVPGTVYPLHRDDLTMRTYVVTAGATDADPERKYFTDGLGAAGHRAGGTRGIATGGPITPAAPGVLDDDDDF